MSEKIYVLVDDSSMVENLIVVPDNEDDLGPAWDEKRNSLYDLTIEERPRGVSIDWGFDPTHPARFGPPFRDEMLDPDPETGEVPDPGPVFSDGKIYTKDDGNWPPSGKPKGAGWQRPT